MNDAIATSGDDERKPVPVRADTIKLLIERPLLALPAEIRPAALLLWTLHKHLKGLESPLPIATAVGLWVSDYGLSVADAVEILRDMCSPAAMAKAEFTSDLITTLALRTHNRLRDRRIEAERAEVKRLEDERNANNLPAEAVREAIRNATKNVSE